MARKQARSGPGKGRRTFRVSYSRAQGRWRTEVRGVPGVHPVGRTVEETRRRLRRALARLFPDLGEILLEERVRLDQAARRSLQSHLAVRGRLGRIQRESLAATSAAARALVEGMGLSVRDAASLLGISHQRVQQLVG